jgi:hypothetical protein
MLFLTASRWRGMIRSAWLGMSLVLRRVVPLHEVDAMKQRRRKRLFILHGSGSLSRDDWTPWWNPRNERLLPVERIELRCEEQPPLATARSGPIDRLQSPASETGQAF